MESSSSSSSSPISSWSSFPGSCPTDNTIDAAPSSMSTTTTLAGRIWPIVRTVVNRLNATELRRISRRLLRVFHYQDLLAILILGWGTVPFCFGLYRLLSRRGVSETIIKPFQNTRLYVIVYHFAQAIQLSLLVYIVDLILVLCLHDDDDDDILLSRQECSGGGGGSSTSNRDGERDAMHPDYSWLFAKILYTLWLAKVMSTFKHYLLLRYLGIKYKKDGLALLIDHLVNAMIGGIAAMVIIDILELSGLGIRSAFALGSAGTLAITLGTQTLVKHIVSGFTMSTSNRFYVGDFVKFGHGNGATGFTGTVLSLGWLETTIRGADELIHTIPNAKLEGIAISNLSRNERCQVKQTLRFHYKDVHKLPALLETIKANIIDATSPHIVTDGSRPCRAVWTDYTERYLEVVVDVHFEGIKPIGTDYWNNRQQVLMAIQKSVDEHGMHFALRKGCCDDSQGDQR